LEAGIESACQIQTHVEAFKQPIHVPSVLNSLQANGNLLLDLCFQSINLSEIAQYTYFRSEQRLVNNLHSTILSHIQVICSTLTTFNELYNNTAVANTDILIYKIKTEKLIQQYVSLLWDKLKFPYSHQFRSLLLKILIKLEEISYLLNPLQPSSPKYLTYNKPHKISVPSFESQVTNPASASLIIDPILKSLQQNYYYPLTYEMPIDEMEYDNNKESTPVAQPPLKPPSKKIETSIDTISDFLQEMEGDDPPTQSDFTTEEVIAKRQTTQVQASFHKHRFSIYRKIDTNAGQSVNSQLNLFKSFSNCLKKIDSQAQILPLRND
jgi:hypothetical protein